MKRILLISVLFAGTIAGLTFFLSLMSLRPAEAFPARSPDMKPVVGLPDMGISKWNTGGHARPGGSFVYGIYYVNNGEVTADDVTIVDTLPAQWAGWADDTSGVTPSQGPGGTVTWNLGSMEPGENAVFMVTAAVSAGAPTGTAVIESNCVTITTTTPGDPNPDNDDACSDPVDIYEDEVEVGIDKRSEPDDPNPGELFLYTLEWCNNRGAAASSVWLTDTLPAETTLQGWQPQPWWNNFWQQVAISDNQITLFAPGLPGDQCGEIDLEVLLNADVPEGTSLENRAVIYADDDVDPENDTTDHCCVTASPPRYDLDIGKDIHAQVPVPGGWINYFIDFANRGNVSTPVVITETVPAGFTYEYAHWGGNQPNENEPLPDPTIVGNLLVWELDPIPVAISRWFHIQMSITDTMEIGVPVQNCVEIGSGYDDSGPDDNKDCQSVNINPPGPNLMVGKSHEWIDEGQQLAYEITFANIGTVPYSNVALTDTLPVSTTQANEPSWDSPSDFNYSFDEAQHQWLFEIAELEPGDRGMIWFDVNLDDPWERPRYYTNTIEINTPDGDINESDNVYEDVAFTGGEVEAVSLWLETEGDSNMWGQAIPDVDVTVDAPDGQFMAHSDPGCGGCWELENVGQLNPGDTVTVTAGAGNLPVIINIPDPFTVNVDSGAGTVSGQIGGWDEQAVEVHGEWDDGYEEVSSGPVGNFTATYDNMPRGSQGYVLINTEVNYADVYYHRPFMALELVMQVNYGHDWIEGGYEPGHTIWITVTESDGVTVKGQAELESDYLPWWDGQSGFSTDWPGWNGDRPDMMPGDWVFGQVDNGYTTTLRIGDVNEQLDVDADLMSGLLEAAWLSPSLVDIRCEIWEENGPDGIEVPGVDPDGGDFECDFSGIWDIQNRDTVTIRYIQPDNNEIMNSFSGPWTRVNYAHDWVGIDYPLDHTFWITVTDSLGAVKATAEIETISNGGWNGSGFGSEDEWVPGRPDITPGDYVYFSSDDGYDNTVRVGMIDGTLNIDTDSVGGPIHADWFGSLLLDVECHPWGAPEGTPSKESSAAADGTQPFECSWDPDTEWNIEPGQQVAAMYIEPDGDRVIDVYADPAPDMRIDKWPVGNQVAPGGPVVFGISYQNDGNAAADMVIITDTLPANTTYIDDTSGVTPQIDGNKLTWLFGPVDVDDYHQFSLVLKNSANDGDTLINEVEIVAPFDSNTDNNQSQAEIEVIDDLPDPYVHKQAEPNDPAAGQTFVYRIMYGNNRPVASEGVWLTDTIPANTSIVSWFSENSYDLWSEINANGKLELYAPSIPGDWHDQIILRLKVDDDVPVETQLINNVVIDSVVDDDFGNNSHEYGEVWIGDPYWNGSVDKNFAWGQLVPGGEIEFHVHVHNSGNMAAQMWLTDTLPASTDLIRSYSWDGVNYIPNWPDSLVDNIAVWDLGIVEPGAFYDFELRLAIDGDLDPDSDLTNCATIGIDGNDSWPFDDEACLVETVRDFGPNLRVSKESWWDGNERLGYQLRLENIGNERLENIWVTDTYPLSTTFTGDWWVNHGPWITITHESSLRQLVFWAEVLEPGDTAQIGFRVDVDSPGVQGLAYTNMVEAPITGDVNMADNSDQVTSMTGPDIYVKKWLSGGEVEAGALVTFTVEFGNKNLQPWETTSMSYLTDTLPAEMAFITATVPWNPGKTWQPMSSDDGVLVWEWDYMCPGCWWQFELTVQINDTVSLGDEMANKLEMYSTEDVEYNYENNQYIFTVGIKKYPLYLPIIIK